MPTRPTGLGLYSDIFQTSTIWIYYEWSFSSGEFSVSRFYHGLDNLR